MIATMEAPKVSKPGDKKKRSDWRTHPRDEFLVERPDGQGYERKSFVSYLVGDYPRGKDWNPCSPVGTIMKLHDTPRNKKGGLSGTPRLTRTFLNWLSEDHESGITHAELRAAIGFARVREPKVMAVLEWRQGFGPSAGLTTSDYLFRHNIASKSTLTTRLYRACELVLDEVDRVRAFKGGR